MMCRSLSMWSTSHLTSRLASWSLAAGLMMVSRWEQQVWLIFSFPLLFPLIFKVDLRHQQEEPGSNIVVVGVDLTEFYMSVEWDILAVPAIRNVKFYTCCDEPYLDITFNITMRRKTLFYTVNLIIPCMGISFLTVLVFYLPSDSGEKVCHHFSLDIICSVLIHKIPSRSVFLSAFSCR